MSASVYVIGAGGHGKVVVATLLASGYEVEGIFDDDVSKAGALVLGVPVLGPVSGIVKIKGCRAVAAIGNNAVRRKMVERLSSAVEWQSVVHPNADVHADVLLGKGSVVFSGAVVQPGSIIGNHVIVNTSASVDHDCKIADYAHVAPGGRLAGDVQVDEGAFIGIGAVALPGVRIGAWATVGAAAAVLKNVPPGATAVGVPARVCARVGADQKQSVR